MWLGPSWTVLQVGVEVPVLTGVRSDDGSCLAVMVLSGTDYSGLDDQAHAQWSAVDCEATADIATLCRQGNPTRGANPNTHSLGEPRRGSAFAGLQLLRRHLHPMQRRRRVLACHRRRA
jgi:hypothetical protein